MKKFKIVTDSCCDLPITYIEKLNIPYVSLTYHYNNVEKLDDFGTSYSLKNFYDDIRNGEMPKTSQPSTHSFYSVFKNIFDEGFDILYIGASSGLSGTVNNAHIAKHMLEDEYSDLNIYIIDILTASLGQGLMVLKSYEMQEQGSSIQDIVNYLEETKQNLNTYMIVNDINYLRKGGRISATAAFAGMLLSIKPFLTISNLGKVLPLDKFRGRKKAINALFEKVLEKIEKPEEQTIAISHGDSIDEALNLKNLILSKVNVKNVLMSYVGPVVGSYGGPGALAVFFLGKKREVHTES
ncbi:DegV family protein [Clostridium thailandense]|uniref:DegV family protein n=1 Tax=Clostridium thailandense TaxID=2794346 RepID=UPI003988BB67